MITGMQAAPEVADRPSPARPRILLAYVVLVVCSYLVGVILPYYVNNLDELPLDRLTAGSLHDPAYLPTTERPLGRVAYIAGVLAVGPGAIMLMLMLMPMAVVAAVGLLRRGRDAGGLTYGLALLLSAAMLTFMFSPVGLIFSAWMID